MHLYSLCQTWFNLKTHTVSETENCAWQSWGALLLHVITTGSHILRPLWEPSIRNTVPLEDYAPATLCTHGTMPSEHYAPRTDHEHVLRHCCFSAFSFDTVRKAFGVVQREGGGAVEPSRLLLEEPALSLQSTQGLVLWAAPKAQWALRCEARFRGGGGGATVT